MTPNIGRLVAALGTRRVAGLAAAVVMLGGFCLSGCSIVKAADKAVHTIRGNKTTIDDFTSKVQSGEAQPFQATYVTTGASPAKIVYAVQPPKDLSFTDTPSGGVNASATFDLIVNSSGEYSCSPPSSGSVTCEKLGAVNASEENSILDFYTPSHWITFLKDFSLAAGFAGDKISSSSMSINGFSLSCVDFVAPGVAGKSTICTTAQGILGYVKVASDSTSFEIQSYAATPTASLFQLPPGAKVVVPTIPTTTTTS